MIHATIGLSSFFVPVAVAAEGADLTAYQDVIKSITDTLSTANLTSVLTYAAAGCIGFVFLWWALRKVSGMFMRAFKRGKLRF